MKLGAKMSFAWMWKDKHQNLLIKKETTEVGKDH